MGFIRFGWIEPQATGKKYNIEPCEFLQLTTHVSMKVGFKH